MKRYGEAGDDTHSPAMRPITAILSILFSVNQPYLDIREIRADTAFELMEAKLDESLGSLDKEKSRLARKAVAVVRDFGSVENMKAEVLAAFNNTKDPDKPGVE